jgi:hypothetical protein
MLGVAALETVEEDRGADVEPAGELGDGADAGLALGALDAGDMGHVQTAEVSEPLLTEAAGEPGLAEVRSELRKGIVHSRILRL